MDILTNYYKLYNGLWPHYLKDKVKQKIINESLQKRFKNISDNFKIDTKTIEHLTELMQSDESISILLKVKALSKAADTTKFDNTMSTFKDI